MLECAFNVASTVERDEQEMFPRAGRVAHEDAIMDDDGQYIHLVGPGKYVEVQETFVGDRTSLSSSIRFCEMDSFEVTTTPADKALGYDTVSTSSPDTKFVSLEAFRVIGSL